MWNRATQVNVFLPLLPGYIMKRLQVGRKVSSEFRHIDCSTAVAG